MGDERFLPNLETDLAGLFGHRAFRDGQREVVESVLSGRDTLAVMPTGGGKSVTYQLPAMLMPGLTLILSPLIALMKDQADNLPAAVAAQTTFINSSLEPDEVARRLRMVRSGRIKLVYAAPERLRQPPFLHTLRQVGVSMVVVDEAHCISQWGHDFRPDYRAVGRAVEALAPRVALAVTATATPRVRDDIERQLGRRLARLVRPTFRENLRLACRHLTGDEDKQAELLQIFREGTGAGLVYCGSRARCEQVAEHLQRNGIPAGYYHAGLPAEERVAAQDRFMSGEVRVLAATVAFGMGIDKPDIRTLVHYHPSRTLENYYQEAGRAGRDGARSQCTLLFARSDAASARRMMQGNEVTYETLKAVYHAIRSRSAMPLSGASGRYARLGWDDLCQHVPGGEGAVRMALPLLEELEVVRRYADIPRVFHLQGPRDPDAPAPDDATRILAEAADQGGAWGPAELSAYSGVRWPNLEFALLRGQEAGLLQYRAGPRDMLLEILPSPPNVREAITGMLRRREAEAEHRMNAILAYARATDCRHVFIARYFGDDIVSGTRCGVCDVCDGRTRPFRFPTTRSERSRPPRRAAIPDETVPGNVSLYEALRAWRTATAREMKIPGYCVFPDKVLRAIAAERPSSEDDILLIPGIGMRKASRYGEELLKIVQDSGAAGSE
ncbi:MAG: RecQ family ATP-dependent DNA helicase [Capsulimonadaceae bacterium]